MRHLTIRGLEHFGAVRACFGSLNAGELDTDNLRESLATIIKASVPEESFPHPQRARLISADHYGATIETPGGVRITLRRGWQPDAVGWIRIDFGRNSEHLASEILEALPADATVEPPWYPHWQGRAADLLDLYRLRCEWARLVAEHLNDTLGGAIASAIGDEVRLTHDFGNHNNPADIQAEIEHLREVSGVEA